MATKARFERNAMVSLAELTDAEDGGRSFVWCSIPGGRPVFQFDMSSQFYVSVDGAPQIETHRQFVEFVSDRWEVV